MTLAAYKFKVGEEGLDTVVDGTAVRWTDAVIVVLAHQADAACELACEESPRDESWIRAVTPERIELDAPKFIALASQRPTALEELP